MSEGIYRDALLGLRSRLVELDARIADTEARFSVELLSHLPAALREQILELREARRPRADTMDELTRAEGQSAAYLEAIERALGLAPELEAELCAVPRAAPELKRARHGSSTPRFTSESAFGEVLATVGAVLARVIARHDPSAEVVPLDDFAFAAQLRAADSPIALLVECFVDMARPYEPRVQIATSVARAVQRVAVLPETWAQDMVRALGFRTSIETGDPDFDGRFVLEGDVWTARTILTPPVRASLLAIAKDDVPSLRVDDGRAVLSWSFEPTGRALDAAFFVLGRVRATDVTLKLAHRR